MDSVSGQRPSEAPSQKLLTEGQLGYLEQLHAAEMAAHADPSANCGPAHELFESSLAGVWPELLHAARLALKAESWLREHSDITGVALSAAENAEHIGVDRAPLRALAALRKEFGLGG